MTEQETKQVPELNIYQKLAKIRKPVEVMQKNKAGYGYKYVTEDQILAKITGLMEKLGVSLVPNIIAGTTIVTPYAYTTTKSTKDGKIYDNHVNEILVQSDMEWHWVNNSDPFDRVVVPWALVGQQSDASQAFGSGLSYSSRYFLLKFFGVATSDNDVDEWRKLQKEAQDAENREISKAIIEQVHTLATSHAEKKPDAKPQIEVLVKRYAKDAKGKATANYNLITDPVAASKLLEELTAFCNTEVIEK